MGEVIWILAVLFLAFVALGVYAGVKVVGAAKRGVERTVTQARRTVEETTLRAKSFGQVGVAGELAQLRLSLRTSMRATQDALDAGASEDASLSESLDLFRRLSAHGHELDGDLKRLERDPDRAAVSSMLPDLRRRTEQITRAAESLRWAARDRAQRFAADDLDVLSSQIDMEAGALRHWTEEPRGDDTARGTSSPAATEAPRTAETVSWPAAGQGAQEPAGPAAPSDAAADAGGAGDGRRQRAADQPQAITARDPRQQMTYTWQKSARPETTN
ncbi:hypothetical protein [Streptomyces genisteinicus]|uniref:Secreted protein n=1 Tax=Streptomyces genisteinicus TaxID=2768068 RepID=A0A7H0HRT9_9ACTN|nr:hypothetical protein [Streptomyces genisteinicus]QNP63255.1 hypothetical protein IAG43_10100 [Streptomyces genisteinicus]